eukprot:scaffold8003_cov115-Isochrysis_galbana.AAC.2
MGKGSESTEGKPEYRAARFLEGSGGAGGRVVSQVEVEVARLGHAHTLGRCGRQHPFLSEGGIT